MCMCIWGVLVRGCVYLPGVGREGDEGKKGGIEKKSRKAEKHREED